ncbi:MAG TPA: ABC transporter permease [Solirubrobacteraceae bacterium]|nr:ABC transporter permease [Solirubrobacteraceae bacterium]
MLEGASPDATVVEGKPSQAHQSAKRESDRLREPRPEIWFRRRVGLVAALKEFWAFRELTFTLAERELRVRYKQAVLGVAWAVIGPVVMMVAFTVLFNRFAKVNTGGAPYALFSYLGLLPWTFFSNSVSNGGLSLVSNNELLNKLYCPREVFPIAVIADSVVDLAIAACVLALLFPITGFAPKVEAYYLPLFLAVMLIFTLGVTLAVSAVVVYARDLRLVLPLAIQVGLFVTPVVYGTGSISSSKAFLIAFSAINPLVPVIDGMRATILNGHAPDWLSLGVGTVAALLYLLGGFKLFKRLETGMADIA